MPVRGRPTMKIGWRTSPSAISGWWLSTSVMRSRFSSSRTTSVRAITRPSMVSCGLGLEGVEQHAHRLAEERIAEIGEPGQAARAVEQRIFIELDQRDTDAAQRAAGAIEDAQPEGTGGSERGHWRATGAQRSGGVQWSRRAAPAALSVTRYPLSVGVGGERKTDNGKRFNAAGPTESAGFARRVVRYPLSVVREWEGKRGVGWLLCEDLVIDNELVLSLVQLDQLAELLSAWRLYPCESLRYAARTRSAAFPQSACPPPNTRARVWAMTALDARHPAPRVARTPGAPAARPSRRSPDAARSPRPARRARCRAPSPGPLSAARGSRAAAVRAPAAICPVPPA